MIFATVNNPVVLEKLQALLGVDITEEVGRIAECEAGIVFARSPAFGLGTADVRSYLDLLHEAAVPCVLVLNRSDVALMDYAQQRGVTRGNMVVPVHRTVSAARVAALVEPFIQSYELSFDPSEGGGPVYLATERMPLVTWPGRNCVLYGVKGGVGVSTTAAFLASALDDGFHLEIVGQGRVPTGYCYHGSSAGEAGGRYGSWDGSGAFPVPEGRAAVIDVNQSVDMGITDELISRAKCFILVADRSEVSFARVGHLVGHGLRPDILLVCGTLLDFGVGYPVDAFREEYGDRLGAIVQIPGGTKTEQVILGAQRKGVPPTELPGGEELARLIGTYTG